MVQLVNLLYTELLKLKRSKMFLVSIIGASAAPIMMFIAYLSQMKRDPEEVIPFEISFYNTNLNVMLLLGVLLYGVITAYLFNREFVEDTLKNLLTIPVSKGALIASKMLMLFIWILLLTMVAWVLTLGFGFFIKSDGVSAAVLLSSLRDYVLGAVLMFLLSTPTIWVTFLFKNYVPTIMFTAVITLGNVTVISSDYKALFPWSAAHVIVTQSYVADYPPLYSFIAVGITSLFGLVASVLYFNRMDIK